MSRKNNKREPPQKWECTSDHERFVRIFESMMESPAFIALSPVATRIYLILKNEYRGNFTMNNIVCPYSTMSESGVGYLDVILDISILCYSFRFKMQWLAVIVNAIVKFVTNQAKTTQMSSIN